MRALHPGSCVCWQVGPRLYSENRARMPSHGDGAPAGRAHTTSRLPRPLGHAAIRVDTTAKCVAVAFSEANVAALQSPFHDPAETVAYRDRRWRWLAAYKVSGAACARGQSWLLWRQWWLFSTRAVRTPGTPCWLGTVLQRRSLEEFR